jgi:hypothetical protein
MADKRDPSQKSIQRWNNEGGAPKGGRAKRPRDPNQLAKSIIDRAVANESAPTQKKPQRASSSTRAKKAK